MKDKRQPVPSLLELKPYVETKLPNNHNNNYDDDDEFKPVRIREVNAPDLSRPHRPHHNYNPYKKSDYNHQNFNNAFMASSNYNNKPVYGVRNPESLTSKFAPPPRQKHTQGFKHYPTLTKPTSRVGYKRPDYNSYFNNNNRKNTPQQQGPTGLQSFANAVDEQAQASWRIIQNMLKQNRVGTATVGETYARDSQNYFL